MHLFYTTLFEDGLAYLSEDESLHAIKVLRMREGQKVELIDGTGGHFQGEISKASAKRCEIRIGKKDFYELNNLNYVHVAIAPTKNSDRIEWFVEKAIEIGVNEISFFYSEHSERRTMNMDRTERVAISAMKQSLKYYLPKINDPIPLDKFILQNQDLVGGKYIAHLNNGNRLNFYKELGKQTRNLVLIGPEGDFTENEVNLAINHNFIPVALGESRLRTETAGMMAVAALQILKTT